MGLVLRIGPGAKKTWAFSYRRPGNGKRTKITIGQFPNTGLVDAKRAVLELRYMLEKGMDPGKQELVDPGVKTFGDIAERYMSQHSKPYKRTWRADRLTLDAEILPRIGDFVVESLTQSDINGIFDPIEKRGAYRGVDAWAAILRATSNSQRRDVLAGVLTCSLSDGSD